MSKIFKKPYIKTVWPWCIVTIAWLKCFEDFIFSKRFRKVRTYLVTYLGRGQCQIMNWMCWYTFRLFIEWCKVLFDSLFDLIPISINGVIYFQFSDLISSSVYRCNGMEVLCIHVSLFNPFTSWILLPFYFLQPAKMKTVRFERIEFLCFLDSKIIDLIFSIQETNLCSYLFESPRIIWDDILTC